jgi:hypothetical protein
MTEALAIVFGLAVLVSLAELVGLIHVEGLFGNFAGREAAAVHGSMNTAMALMATPAYSHGWHRGMFALFLVSMAGLGLRFALVLRRPQATDRSATLAGTGYHFLSTAAMLYALARMPMAGPLCGDMPGPGAVAWVMVALFACDAVATLWIVSLKPDLVFKTAGAVRARPGKGATQAIRLTAVPHVIMDLGMVGMLAWPAAMMA